MPEIRNLNSIDTPQQSDLLPVYSQQNGATRKLSFGNLMQWIQEMFVSPSPKAKVVVSSTSGNVLIEVPKDYSLWYVVKPKVNTLDSVDIQLPQIDAQLPDGAEVGFSLEVPANYVSVNHGLSVDNSEQYFTFRYCKLDAKWHRSA